jgi:hypothetical protein
MKTSWTDGLESDVAKEVRLNFKESRIMRERLKVMLDKKINSNRSSVTKKDAYNSPNWALLQADNVGYERAMKEILSVLD